MRTEEHAKQRRNEGYPGGNGRTARKLADLRKQWEFEKSGLGDTA